jgi:hypothetical protein
VSGRRLFLSFNSGALQEWVYKKSHFALAGPDPEYGPLANVIQFAPPAVHTAGGDFYLGRVTSSKSLSDGPQVVQALGATQITARVTFPHEGVMRYEVTDWSNAATSRMFADLGNG